MADSHSDDFIQALVSGLSGSVVLTLVHQAAKELTPDAPRMDVLGVRGLGKLLAAAEAPHAGPETADNVAMAGDLLVNGLYYSLVGSGPDAWWRGAALGVAAGVGGVVLPGRLSLGEGPSNR